MLMYSLYTALQGIFLPCTRGLANGLGTVFIVSSTVWSFDDFAVNRQSDPVLKYAPPASATVWPFPRFP